DGPPTPPPVRRCGVLELPAGVASQAGQQPLGQPAAGLAISPGIRRASRQALGGPVGQQAGNGLAAGVIRVEDLAEEDPEGDQRREQSVAETDVLRAEDLSDLARIEQVGERQAGGLRELTAERGDWAGPTD